MLGKENEVWETRAPPLFLMPREWEPSHRIKTATEEQHLEDRTSGDQTVKRQPEDQQSQSPQRGRRRGELGKGVMSTEEEGEPWHIMLPLPWKSP